MLFWQQAVQPVLPLFLADAGWRLLLLLHPFTSVTETPKRRNGKRPVQEQQQIAPPPRN
jgi:hypothetical protein